MVFWGEWEPPGYVNAASRQSASGARTPCAVSTTRAVWDSVRDQVFDAGCVHGLWFPAPQGDPPVEPPQTTNCGRPAKSLPVADRPWQ